MATYDKKKMVRVFIVDLVFSISDNWKADQDIEDSRAGGDTKFLFECSTRYFTSECIYCKDDTNCENLTIFRRCRTILEDFFEIL